MAQSPDPVELYEAAVQRMLTTLEGVQPGQLESPTPCTEWNVQSLINHNLRVALFCEGVLIGESVSAADMFLVSGPRPPEGGASAFQSNANAVMNAARSMDLTTVMETPFGVMPGGNFLQACMNDVVVHTWDLSKATGQDTALDPQLAEICYNNLVRAFERGRPGTDFFGPEISVPASGSMQDKLLGIAGRTP